MVSEVEKYIQEKHKFIKNQGFWGAISKDCNLLLCLAVAMVVFVVAMFKSNLERILKKNIHIRIKENSIPPCRTSPFARVYMESFHFT